MIDHLAVSLAVDEALVGVEVRVGEVDLLLAVVRDGDGTDGDVGLAALLDGGDDGVELDRGENPRRELELLYAYRTLPCPERRRGKRERASAAHAVPRGGRSCAQLPHRAQHDLRQAPQRALEH